MIYSRTKKTDSVCFSSEIVKTRSHLFLSDILSAKTKQQQKRTNRKIDKIVDRKFICNKITL